MNRRALLAGGAAGLLSATGFAAYAAGRARTPAQRAAQASAPDSSVITVPVRRGRLLDESILDGQLQRAVSIDIPAPVSVSGATRLVVTRTRSVGERIGSGEVLLEVSGRPMLVLPGGFPAFRDLGHGDTGPDVKQLQAALRKHFGTPATGVFDARTENDVRRLYRKAGYEPVMNEDEVPAISGAVPTAPPAKRVGLPAAEVVFVPELPVQIAALPVRLGGEAKGTVASLSAGAWRVIAPLDGLPEQALQRDPESAAPTLGRGPGEGRPTELLEITVKPAQERTPESRQAVFLVPGELEAQPGAAQQVRLTRARSSESSLIVPLPALWTAADGTVSVTVVKGGNQNVVPVTVIVSVLGEAAITGEVAEGDRVVVGGHG